jgi:hypothetical protein
MHGAVLISYIALWGLVVFQSGLLLVLLREIGKTYLRDSPSFQRDGLAVGRRLPPLRLETRDGATAIESFFGARIAIFLLASDGCAVCGPVADIVQRWSERLHDVSATVLLSAERLGAWGGTGMDVGLVRSSDVAEKLEVRATPFVFVTDRSGRVVAKGLINTHAHLKALLKEARAKTEDAGRQAADQQLLAVAGEPPT